MLSLVTGADTPILLKKTKRVKYPLSQEIQSLILEMMETMRQAKGIGLAAPQIGQSLRLAVAEVDGKIFCLINPEITSYSQEKIICEEGCLSLPGSFLPILRSEKVTVRYKNEKGLPKKTSATKLLAIVIQHEVDHLDGILIINRHKKQQQKNSFLKRKEL
jgi:peptide deformylase